jgi:zinc/manganese transport system substrate-binding protein
MVSVGGQTGCFGLIASRADAADMESFMLKKSKLVIGFLAVLGLFIVPATGMAKTKVVASLGDLGAVARAVGGDDVTVKVLASPQEDPHFVDAKPSYVKELATADLVMLNGMSLEIGWLPTLIDNARNGNIQRGEPGYFDASTAVERKEVPKTEVTRAMGDVHPEGNPHYTLAPKQMARVSLALAKRLGKIDPKHKEAYTKRAKQLAKDLLRITKKWQNKFQNLPQACRNVTVYHEAWIYLREWLGLEEVAAIEPKPGVEPNPSHTAKVIETMKANAVPVVLRMEYYPSSTVQQIAEKTGAKVITSKGQARPDQTYESRVKQLVTDLYDVYTSSCGE